MQNTNTPHSHSHSQSQRPRTNQQGSTANNASTQGGNSAYGHGYAGSGQPQHPLHSHGTGTHTQTTGSSTLRPMPFTQNPANPTGGYQQSYGEGNEAEPYLAPNVPAHYRNYRPLHQGHPIVPSQQPPTGTQFIPTPSQLVGAFPSSTAPAHPSYASRGSGGTQGASSSAAHAASTSTSTGSPIICEICGPSTTFTRPHDRKRHFESHHSNESQHICIYCHKAYARADSLKRHYDKPCDKDPRGGAGKA